MTEARRWYDKDPVLKEALELLRLQTDETKAEAADYILTLQEQVAADVIEHLYETIAKYQGKGNRWYDNDPVMMKAIEMVTTNLPQSYLGDRHARAEMHIAQCLAGMAFSNALLGIVHSMAHKTGAVFSKGSMEKRHLTHGCANAIYLPYVIRYNSVENSALNRYADIARMLGLSGGSAEALMLALCRRIDSLNDIFSIPHTLREYGIDEGEFLEKLPAIAENAVGDACTGSNPRPIDSEKMAELFKCCYYGTPVNL